MNGYRTLKKGEIIEAGDEYDACSNAWKDDANWKPAPEHMIGKPASDPKYPAHTIYRRRLIPENGVHNTPHPRTCACKTCMREREILKHYGMVRDENTMDLPHEAS